MKNVKTIKHILKGVLLPLFCLLLSFTALAADGQISFSDPQALSGSEVNVTMKISAAEGTRLADATVTLTYPQDRLEFVSGTDASGGAGTIRVHGVTNGGGSNTLEYNLKFNTSSAGSYTINIDTQEVYDEDGAMVNMTHLGNSTITVNAAESVSQNADLSSLEVSPGELEPAFDPGVTSYTTTVGASVDSLGINALTADSGASVIIQNNEGFAMGQNTVTVSVTAPDGQTIKDYVITVNKEEGGPEAPVSDAETAADIVEGVQLSSRGKTITIMYPGDDVAIPEGFTEAIITIDGQKVRGWFWGADEDPEYCVVYGMNDRGELNFYRYDLSEKTLQRYFSDPMSADAVSNAEYTELMTSYDELQQSYDLRFVIICVLCAVCLALLVTTVWFSSKLRSMDRETRKLRKTESRRRGRHHEEARKDIEPEMLSHDYEMEPEESYEEMEETQIISGLSAGRSEQRSEASDQEMADAKAEAYGSDERAQDEGTDGSMDAPEEAMEAEDKVYERASVDGPVENSGKDDQESEEEAGDDTFESFDI